MEAGAAINLVGVFSCTHAALPGDAGGRLRADRQHRLRGRAGRLQGLGRLSAAKGGIVAIHEGDRPRERPYGITANAIAPGPIETPLLMGAKEFGEIGEKVIETMKSSTQLGRLGKPEEVAAAAAFLASDDATYVTGETLGVSGGAGNGLMRRRGVHAGAAGSSAARSSP